MMKSLTAQSSVTLPKSCVRVWCLVLCAAIAAPLLMACTRYPRPRDGNNDQALMHNVLLHQMYWFNYEPVKNRADIYIDRRDVENTVKSIERKPWEQPALVTIGDAKATFDVKIVSRSTREATVSVCSRRPSDFNHSDFGGASWTEVWVMQNDRWKFFVLGPFNWVR